MSARVGMDSEPFPALSYASQSTHACLYVPKATFSFLYPPESGPLPVTGGSAHDPIEEMTVCTIPGKNTSCIILSKIYFGLDQV